jgi:hypothetical protein
VKTTSSGPSYQFIGSEALQAQIELLKFYPEIFDKHFYPALKEVAELVKEKIRPRLPHHTGRLENALGSKVIHSGTSALGTRADIGFGKRYGRPSAPYAAPLSEGSKAHDVAGRRREDGLLHFSSRDRFTAIGSISHPGLAPLGFMEGGLADARPGIDRLIDTAAEAVVQELARS